MTKSGFDIDEIERLLAAATPGQWGIWFEQINGQADKAIQELIEQVHATQPISNSLVMLNADGKCPAITGCGPTSADNAALIVTLHNSAPAMIAELRELRAAVVSLGDGARAGSNALDAKDAQLAELRAENARLREMTATNKQAWDNALELGLIPERHRNTVQIMSDGCRAALQARGYQVTKIGEAGE